MDAVDQQSHTRMRAICYHGPGDVRLEEIPESQVGAQQVKIKVSIFFLFAISRHYALMPLFRSHGEFCDRTVPIDWVTFISASGVSLQEWQYVGSIAYPRSHT